MSAAAPEPLRAVPFPRAPERRRAREGFTVAVVIAFAVATLGAFGWSIARGRHAMRGVPPEQRAALLSRTLDEVRRSCGKARAPALDDHCRELAAFAARFDECRDDCAAQIRPLVTPYPTR